MKDDRIVFCCSKCGVRTSKPKEHIHRTLCGRCFNITKEGIAYRKELGNKQSLRHKGYKLSIETRKKMSESRKGHPTSEETKKKISISNTGKIRTEENKRKISETLKGHSTSKESIEKLRLKSTGKKMSEEAKRKISLAHTGKKLSLEHRLKLSLSGKGKNRQWKRARTLEDNQRMKYIRSQQIMPMIDSKIEVKIQNYLKELNIEFIKHRYMSEIIHAYRCDIFIPSLNLVLECDGDYWHHYPIGKDLDKIRNAELIGAGFNLLRLWEHEIKVMTLPEFKISLEGFKCLLN